MTKAVDLGSPVKTLRSLDQLFLGHAAVDGAGETPISNHDTGPGDTRYRPGVGDHENEHCRSVVAQTTESEAPGILLGVLR